jgi:hypothetical protein
MEQLGGGCDIDKTEMAAYKTSNVKSMLNSC